MSLFFMDIATFSATLLLFITFYMKSYNLNKLRRESKKRAAVWKKKIVCFETFFSSPTIIYSFSLQQCCWCCAMDRGESRVWKKETQRKINWLLSASSPFFYHHDFTWCINIFFLLTHPWPVSGRRMSIYNSHTYSTL